jgi:hypothetical protein
MFTEAQRLENIIPAAESDESTRNLFALLFLPLLGTASNLGGSSLLGSFRTARNAATATESLYLSDLFSFLWLDEGPVSLASDWRRFLDGILHLELTGPMHTSLGNGQ